MTQKTGWFMLQRIRAALVNVPKAKADAEEERVREERAKTRKPREVRR